MFLPFPQHSFKCRLHAGYLRVHQEPDGQKEGGPMKIKCLIKVDKVIEYRLKKRKRWNLPVLSPMDNMCVVFEFRVDYTVLARVRLRVTDFGKFTKEAYYG